MRRALISGLVVLPLAIGVLFSRSYLTPSTAAIPTPTNQAVETAMAPIVSVTPSETLIDNFPETVIVKDGDKEIEVRYTGKILRKRPIVMIPMSIYEIASYVEDPAEGDTEALLDHLLVDGRTKVFIIRFLMPLPGKAILNDIKIALEESFGDVDMKSIEPEINRFCSQFGRGSSRGDLVHIVWLKGGRIFSAFDHPEQLEFIAQHQDMARAIWRIWTGPESENRINLVERYSKSTDR